MTDCFQLLHQPYRPYLPPEAMKVAYLQLSNQHHPDKTTPQPPGTLTLFPLIQQAYSCLTNPKDRIAHLLDLEHCPIPPSSSIPDTILEWFPQVSHTIRHVDAFLDKKKDVQSPLLLANLLDEGIQWHLQIEKWIQKISIQLQNLDNQLLQLNPYWEAQDALPIGTRASHLPLQALHTLHSHLTYLLRWNSQLKDRLLKTTW